jgi:hypothetical protein
VVPYSFAFFVTIFGVVVKVIIIWVFPTTEWSPLGLHNRNAIRISNTGFRIFPGLNALIHRKRTAFFITPTSTNRVYCNLGHRIHRVINQLLLSASVGGANGLHI